jgi:PTH1 family peptidyl-tRNA hydrolase
MTLIIGLGNPGNLYAQSRHNIGSSVIRALADNYKAVLKKDNITRALSAKVMIGAQETVLAIPLTYMNLSGPAARSLVKKHKIDLKDLLVVCDDLDLEFGRIRMRPEGSYGGHRGLESVIAALGSKEFSRLRIGIDRPLNADEQEISEYVLAPFSKKVKAQLQIVVENACECCQAWVEEGVAAAMNKFNKKA